jgi:glycosyltransferase involved in cell wall biosynthesis
VIAIDETVQASLPPGLRSFVIHNGLTPPDADGGRASPPAVRPFTVGMVGNLLRVKGCLEFAKAAAVCRARGLDVHFSYVGQSPRPARGLRHLASKLLGVAQEVEAEIRAFVAREGLEDRVHFLPFSLDLAAVYGGLDVVCFPSHLDAPGRPIFEAAFYGVPAIAAISEPKPDTFLPGETGLIVPAADPSALADAIELLYRDPARRLRMGAAARALAQVGFDARTNARQVLQLYRDVLAERATAPAAAGPRVSA